MTVRSDKWNALDIGFAFVWGHYVGDAPARRIFGGGLGAADCGPGLLRPLDGLHFPHTFLHTGGDHGHILALEKRNPME